MSRFQDVKDAERIERERIYILEHLQALVNHATINGYVITVGLVPTTPFEMGKYTMAPDVRRQRGLE